MCEEKRHNYKYSHILFPSLLYFNFARLPAFHQMSQPLVFMQIYVYKNSLAIYIRTALYLKYGGNGMTLFVYVVYNFNFCVFSLFIDVNHLLFLFSPTGVNAFVVLELNVCFKKSNAYKTKFIFFKTQIMKTYNSLIVQ